ncbi:MAG TPA: YggS family pyridoxal phosphate-dependent enzyme [Balneolaceae bacterium]|nr:YggS family pyridoxal phosphate-dependent enzyme [Balneolaceae bacterium]
MSEICENIDHVQQRIKDACNRAGRDPADIQLVAISKTKPMNDIEEAFGCGQVHFGENRAKELQDKMESCEIDEIQWHMVGNLQTNKIKYMVERVNWIDSVPKQKSFHEIEKRASRIDRTINTLVQVNISGEDQKSGCVPNDLEEILDYARPLDHVNVRGLMGMATFTDDMDVVRDEFKLLKDIFDQHAENNSGSVQLEHLSMGMTNDFEIAIEEGSTMIRVGRAIFGERNYG